MSDNYYYYYYVLCILMYVPINFVYVAFLTQMYDTELLKTIRMQNLSRTVSHYAILTHPHDIQLLCMRVQPLINLLCIYLAQDLPLHASCYIDAVN